MAAVKDLGPDIAGKAMPGLALAKGLAKSESDGSLSWLVELDAERSIKVNGIPFGKAPDRRWRIPKAWVVATGLGKLDYIVTELFSSTAAGRDPGQFGFSWRVPV